MAIDLKKLLIDVFDPQPGEVVIVARDQPADNTPDDAAWQSRRRMAEEWHNAFSKLGDERGFTTQPLLNYAATGANGAELPMLGVMAGRSVNLEAELLSSTLACFLTQFSATAALSGFCRRKTDFRAASCPGLEKRMEGTSLSADYREVARRCKILEDLLRGAERVDVHFSTGESCLFDIRFRKAEVDDGFLPRGKQGDRIINLPSGETFIVPYEGENAGIPSETKGELPVSVGGEKVVLRVSANRIADIVGVGKEAARLRQCFELDPTRRNIAEVAFGCNERAVVTGNVLEDEKAGFHWAYGRSDHLGGTVGVEAFLRPDTVVHQDVVYAKGNPIQVVNATVLAPGRSSVVIRNGEYLVF